jgi:hypothetical protein
VARSSSCVRGYGGPAMVRSLPEPPPQSCFSEGGPAQPLFRHFSGADRPGTTAVGSH